MIDFINETPNSNFDNIVSELADILYDIQPDKEVELLFVDNAQIKKINNDNRGINKETDVLSFPIDFPHQKLIGTIIISIDKAIEVANKFQHSTKDEIKLLFIHGVLHLLGYDHETDNQQMRNKEEEIIKKLNLPTSLIVRAETN